MAKHDPRVPFMMRALDLSSVAYHLAGLLCWRYGDNKEGGAIFPAQETLAADLHISIRHLRNVVAELKPIGLKVRIRRGPRTGKDQSYYSFGPAIPEPGDLNASRNSGTQKPKSASNSGTEAPPISEIWSNNSGTDSTTTQKNTQKSTQERESAARSALSEAPDFENLEVRQGEILPPRTAGNRTGKPTPLPDDWQPDDQDWAYAAEKGLTAEDIQNEAQAFKDWCAERGKTSANWSASWRRFLGHSRQNRRNQRKTLASRAAELAHELEIKEAAMRAAGIDPRPQPARHSPPPAPDPTPKQPTWSDVFAIIKRKVPPGAACNRAEASFTLRSYQAGVLEIAVENGHLYPPSNRELLGSYIRDTYPAVTHVRFVEHAA
jgi:hypothetical protein